jgi:hypothetical protein
MTLTESPGALRGHTYPAISWSSGVPPADRVFVVSANRMALQAAATRGREPGDGPAGRATAYPPSESRPGPPGPDPT